MPKRDKSREMGERLNRIQEGLNLYNLTHKPVHLNTTIRQLGNGLDLVHFDPSLRLDELQLYEEARKLDKTAWPPARRAQRLEQLYGQVQAAFNAYKAGNANAAATGEQEAPQGSVDDTIEEIPFGGEDSGLDAISAVYRTAETRRLDGKLGDSRIDFSLITSPVMYIFGEIVSDAGYFAGVKVDELKEQLELDGTDRNEVDASLDECVTNGLVVLKRLEPKPAVEIAVPVKLYETN